MNHQDCMRKAIALAVENVENGGGPFGAVIVKNGEVVAINNPNDATALKIGMVHQHFKLVDVLTAAENIVLGLEEKLHQEQKQCIYQTFCPSGRNKRRYGGILQSRI